MATATQVFTSAQYATENTDKLCAQARQKWSEIRENCPEEQVVDFDLCLTALLSRITGVSEVISGGMAVGGSSRKS